MAAKTDILPVVYDCAYTGRMELEWDSRKAAANLKKHGIDFADAATALHDDLAITIRQPYAGEDRYITIGADALGQILVVVYTWRGDRVRMISARSATPRERRLYQNEP